MNSVSKFSSNLGKISLIQIFFASASELLIIFLMISIISPFIDLPMYFTTTDTKRPAITFDIIGYEGFPIYSIVFSTSFKI